MFDVVRFYESAELGLPVDVEAFGKYLLSFKQVIIWGAGNLGTALGKAFIKNKFKIDAYWDIRYQDVFECNGVRVIEPFTVEYDPEETLVVIGIVNGTLSHKWQPDELRKHGYPNYLLGMYVYEAIACPLKKGEPYRAGECVNTNICNFNTCKRYMNILKDGKEKTGLSVQVLEIIVSSRCTLDCIHCGQQAGATKRKYPEKYRDYPADVIKHSIDLIMDRLDVVGTFSVIGGEPFIHPQIGEIIRHCLTKDNVGIISITSNGICKLTDELLEQIKDDRVKINFSNYTDALGEREKQLFKENVEKIRRHGFSCNVGTPIWNTVNDNLRDNPDFSDATLDAKKSDCVFGPSVAGNMLFACPQTERNYRMEIRDVSEDVIDLSIDEEHLTEKIRSMLDKKHYMACGYICSNGLPSKQIPPGEQWRS